VPRAPEDSMRPRHLFGAVGRPLNFTVRAQLQMFALRSSFLAPSATAFVVVTTVTRSDAARDCR
jgi:hypothetical protein